MNSEPFYVEIEEIREHINSLESKEDKVEYLTWLRYKYIFNCYNSNDDIIDFLISPNEIHKKYERIPYSERSDTEQTHISHSEFMLLSLIHI